jgi:hypothetical protein
MDCFKMIRILFIFLFFFASHSFAQTVPAKAFFNVTGNQYTTANASTQYSSPELACQAVYTNSTHPSKKASTLVGNICQLSYTTTTSTSDFPVYTVYACPAPLTQVGSGTPNANTVCNVPACPTGQVWNNATNSCAQDCMPYKGQTVEFYIRGSANLPDNGNSICMDNQCEAITVGSEGACLGTTSKQCFGNAIAKYSGSSCSQSSKPLASFTNPANQNPPPTNTPEADCIKQGKSFGTINGQVVCVSQGTPGSPVVTSTGTSSTSTETTNPDGSTNSSGSSQTDTVSQDGAIVKTETKTENSDGTITTETKEQPIDKFCEQNPNSKLCKLDSESKFAGSCAASFTCEGDAIQCAIALKQHQAYCEAIEDNPVRDQFTSEVAENAGKGLSDWIPQSVINIPTDLTGQKLLSSACIPDMTFPLAGQSFTLPLSKLCPALEFCGTIVKLFSYLFSAIIIFGRRGA